VSGDIPGQPESPASGLRGREMMSGITEQLLAFGRVLLVSSRFWLGAFVVLLIILHGFVPNAFKVDGFTVALLAILLVLALRPYLKSFSLPGGGGGVFRDEIDALEQKVMLLEALPPSSRTTGAIRRAEAAPRLSVPSELRSLAAVHPNGALAGLRVEIERFFLSEYRRVYETSERKSLSEMIRKLAQDERLDPFVASLSLDLVAVANSAAHAEPITPSQAEEIFDLVERLQALIDESPPEDGQR
jgi:membrane protein implicated in regulation of membrane protease activity